MQHLDVIDNKLIFSLRIVSLDYYLAPPIQGLDVSFSSLEGIAVDLVPIVRVFGSTPAGQRVCLHLHQVLRLTAAVHACCATAPAAAQHACHTTPNHAAQYLRLLLLQAYPYFYVPYADDLPSEPAEGEVACRRAPALFAVQ
jgi:hypothetical protein